MATLLKQPSLHFIYSEYALGDSGTPFCCSHPGISRRCLHLWFSSVLPGSFLLISKSSLAPAGLIVCDKKCQCYSSYLRDDGPKTISLMSSLFQVLGTRIGNLDYESSRCLSAAEDGEELCDKLLTHDDPNDHVCSCDIAMQVVRIILLVQQPHLCYNSCSIP